MKFPNVWDYRLLKQLQSAADPPTVISCVPYYGVDNRFIIHLQYK